MRYRGEDEMSQVNGIGLYLGADGNLYEWVEGVDSSDDVMGLWDGLPQSEDQTMSGLGALYQAPDGTLYQMQGLGEEEAAEAGAQAEAVQEGAAQSESAAEDGPPKARSPRMQARRRFVQRRPGRPGFAVRRAVPPTRRRRGGFFKKLLPIAKLASRFIPIPGAGALVRGGLTVAGKLLKPKGVAGYEGLGALYAASDGSLYQIQGLADEELRGFAENEDLKGFAEDEELRGLDADEELRGLQEDQELRGLHEDEDLRGLAEDEERPGVGEDQDMQGYDGYVRDDGMRGLEAYVPQTPPQTPWHVVPTEPPEMWKPLW